MPADEDGAAPDGGRAARTDSAAVDRSAAGGRTDGAAADRSRAAARTDDLTCHQLVGLITDYLEGVLSPAERERFEAHLDRCENCRAYLAQMRHTLRLLGRLTAEAIAPEMRERLLTAFRGWKRRHHQAT